MKKQRKRPSTGAPLIEVKNLFVDNPTATDFYIHSLINCLLGQLAGILADFLHEEGVLLVAQPAPALILFREGRQNLRVLTGEAHVVVVVRGFGLLFVFSLVGEDFHHRLLCLLGAGGDLGTNGGLDFGNVLENHVDLVVWNCRGLINIHLLPAQLKYRKINNFCT